MVVYEIKESSEKNRWLLFNADDFLYRTEDQARNAMILGIKTAIQTFPETVKLQFKNC